MESIPKKIYLQVDPDGNKPDNFNDLEGISWCQDRINDNDIEYQLVESPSEEGKEKPTLKINNPLPFIMGNLHSHVDRILRDKGMMHKDISEAIMSYTSDPFLNNYLSKLIKHCKLTGRLSYLCKHEFVVKDQYWSSCIYCGMLKPSFLL